MAGEKTLAEPAVMKAPPAPVVEQAPAPAEPDAIRPRVARLAVAAAASAGDATGSSPMSPPAGDGLLGRAGLMRSYQQALGNTRVARLVVAGAPLSVQRQCTCEGNGGAGGECPSCQAEGQVQRQAADEDAPARLPPSVSRAMNTGGGQALPRQVRGPMEQAFGTDFGGVRIHTDAQAARAAADINAYAFTAGQDVYFGSGRFQPETQDGKKLLAHELTHTVQQRGAGPSPGMAQTAMRVSQPGDPEEREAESAAGAVTAGQPAPLPGPATPGPGLARDGAPGPAPPAPAGGNTVSESVAAIIYDLKGITTSAASARILNQFLGRDAASIQSILDGLKAQAGNNDETPDGMIDWLFGDITAEDARKLRQTLAATGVIDDLARITAGTIQGLRARLGNLGGLLTGSDSQAIVAAFNDFTGPRLDAFLARVGQKLGADEAGLGAAIFGKLDREPAEQLRKTFLTKGGPTANLLAIDWTVGKIFALLGPKSSGSDSAAVAWYFEGIPAELRAIAFGRLDARLRRERSKSAEDALTESLDLPDYEAIRHMSGITLKPYVDRRPEGRKSTTVGSVLLDLLMGVGCGLIGVVTGILSVAWDLLKGIWDIAVAAKHILFWIAYVLTDGGVGRDDKVAITEFFASFKSLAEPGKLWKSYSESVEAEYRTIEGDYRECRRIELVVRKVVAGLVNIILVFVGGLGLAKAAVTSVRLLAEFALLVREIGILQALVRVVAGAAKAARAFVAASVAEGAELLRALFRPVETLVKIGRRLNALVLATRNRGVWASLKGLVGDLAESEAKHWQDEKEKWGKLLDGPSQRHADLADEAATIGEKLGEDQKPADPNAIKSLDGDAAKLDADVGDVEKEVIGKEQGGEKPAVEAAPGAGAEASAGEAGVKGATDQIRHAVCGFCFPAGTKLLVPEGRVNIEDVRPGQLVLTRHESFRGETFYARVVRTFQHVTDELIEVIVAGQRIRSTPGHVWWVEKKGWVLAEQLEAGDEVVASDLSTQRITSVLRLEQFAVTYNCEVEAYHTFFVAADDDSPGVWVHNQSLGVRVLRPEQVYQLILPEIIITDREAIRAVVGKSLQATGNYSTELRGLYAFLRSGGGAGYQGVTAEAISRLEVVLSNLEEKGGGVVAAIDLESIGASRVFELTDPAVMNRLLKAYPNPGIEKFFARLASEGVVAVRGKIPAKAVRSLVNIPETLSATEKEIILKELLRPCKP
jgi:hypothetical protein